MYNKEKVEDQLKVLMKTQVIKAQAWLGGLMPRALAQDTPPETVTSYGGLISAIGQISSWMYGILMALGVVFVLYAAFLYLISQGSEERIGVAKRVLIYAIVALVVGVLAGGVSSMIKDWGTGISD